MVLSFLCKNVNFALILALFRSQSQRLFFFFFCTFWCVKNCKFAYICFPAKSNRFFFCTHSLKRVISKRLHTFNRVLIGKCGHWMFWSHAVSGDFLSRRDTLVEKLFLVFYCLWKRLFEDAECRQKNSPSPSWTWADVTAHVIFFTLNLNCLLLCFCDLESLCPLLSCCLSKGVTTN